MLRIQNVGKIAKWQCFLIFIIEISAVYSPIWLNKVLITSVPFWLIKAIGTRVLFWELQGNTLKSIYNIVLKFWPHIIYGRIHQYYTECYKDVFSIELLIFFLSKHKQLRYNFVWQIFLSTSSIAVKTFNYVSIL